MSDFSRTDARPNDERYGPLRPAVAVGEEVYVYHHAGLIGLEIGPWVSVPNSPHVTVGLTPDQARWIAQELLDRSTALWQADIVDTSTAAAPVDHLPTGGRCRHASRRGSGRDVEGGVRM